MSDQQPTCEERIPAYFKSAMEDLEKIFEEPEYDEEAPDPDDRPSIILEMEAGDAQVSIQERWQEYEEGILCIQVPAWVPDPWMAGAAFIIQVQLSWGGPADGFIVELDRDKRFLRARYYFQDWWDYAQRFMDSDETEMLEQVIGEMVEGWIDENEDDVLEWMQEADEAEEEEECGSGDPDTFLLADEVFTALYGRESDGNEDEDMLKVTALEGWIIDRYYEDVSVENLVTYWREEQKEEQDELPE